MTIDHHHHHHQLKNSTSLLKAHRASTIEVVSCGGRSVEGAAAAAAKEKSVFVYLNFAHFICRLLFLLLYIQLFISFTYRESLSSVQ